MQKFLAFGNDIKYVNCHFRTWILQISGFFPKGKKTKVTPKPIIEE